MGTLRLLDVRTVWANEATGFTPWLADEDNIQHLGNALGFELEVEGTEVPVGPYSADVLARDTSTGDYVVIENQLEKTDHDHLGKSITYASVLDASAVVWIARQFTEEHKRALDWLNDKTTDDVAFYGVRLELWQIDDSRPALKFNVISRPTEIVRSVAAAKASGPLSEVRRIQLEFWTEFAKGLVEREILTSARMPRPQYWYNVALGRTGMRLSNWLNVNAHRIGVRVYLTGRYDGQAALAQLLEQKDEIEREIGETLQWDPNPDARDKTIALYRDANLRQRERWDEHLEWMLNMTERFRRVFMPRIKSLDLSRVESEQADVEEAEGDQ
jgi:hypothetical protein